MMSLVNFATMSRIQGVQVLDIHIDIKVLHINTIFVTFV